MDDKTKALCEELIVIIVVDYVENEQGILFDSLYPVFNYGFGTISDLLKIMVSEGQVNVSFDQDKPKIGCPDAFLPITEQVKKLHICSDSTTYIFPTAKGRDLAVQILNEIREHKREFKFTGMLKHK